MRRNAAGELTLAPMQHLISVERKHTFGEQSPVGSVNAMKITETVEDRVSDAERGDLDAQYDLAESYRRGGHGFAKNYVEAEKWYLPNKATFTHSTAWACYI